MTETSTRNNSFFRQLLFVGLLVLIGVVIFDRLAFFVGSALGAITLYVIFRNILFTMTEKWHWRHWLAALVLTLACAVILVGAGYGMVKLISAEMPSIDTTHFMDRIKGFADDINSWIGADIVPPNIIEKSVGMLSKLATSIFNTTYSFVANILFMLVILYFMFASGRAMERNISRYLPLHGQSMNMIRAEAKNMIYSNAIGIPLVMLCQTITASLVYWVFKIDNYIFWGFLTALCGLIPLIGTGLVYLPIGIIMMVQGNVLGGILLIVASLLIVGNTDNVIRIVLMHRINDTHPLVVIFGVIIGIPLFGFWGIIFGPLLISGFLLLIKIYYTEYGLIDPEDIQQETEVEPMSAKASRKAKRDKLRVMRTGCGYQKEHKSRAGK